ncbi:MAG: L-rhamnose mutarotase [Opitutales bacterium]|jgi:L-rhamnose mutarotase|nr:L-rhamnose mutarotase [Opitutales bacterium]
MMRNAFKMKLKAGFEVEYKKRHDEIWPELSAELSSAGVSDYSIFLDEETLTLSAVQKLSDNHTSDQLPRTEIVKKWWAYMGDIMETNPDNSPVCIPLQEVFHAD